MTKNTTTLISTTNQHRTMLALKLGMIHGTFENTLTTVDELLGDDACLSDAFIQTLLKVVDISMPGLYALKESDNPLATINKLLNAHVHHQPVTLTEREVNDLLAVAFAVNCI